MLFMMNNFEQITSMEQIDYFLHQNKLAFLFISRPNCSVCVSLFPQVEEILLKYPKIKLAYINAGVLPEVASKFSIFAVPVLLLFVEGKEYVREARIVALIEFESKIKKIYDNQK